MRKPDKRQSGFTLLELLMVVIIIAILASIALPQYIKASEKARSTEALSALGELRTAELRYKAVNSGNNYTATFNDLDVEIGLTPGAFNLSEWTTSAAAFGLTGVTGAVPAKGMILYSRKTGQYQGQVVGIRLGSGTLCGNFVPLGFGVNNCTQD